MQGRTGSQGITTLKGDGEMQPEILANHSVKHHNAYLARKQSGLGTDVKAERHSRRLAEVIEMAKIVRRHGDLMTTQAFQVVMEVALEPGITMQTLEQRTGLSHASISRNLSALSHWHRLGKPGLGMVEKVQDPTESRRQIAFLTSKGREFVEDVLSAGKHAEDRVHLDAPTAKDFINKVHKTHR